MVLAWLSSFLLIFLRGTDSPVFELQPFWLSSCLLAIPLSKSTPVLLEVSVGSVLCRVAVWAVY